MTLARPVPAVVVDASAMVQLVTGDPAWVERMARWQSSGALLLAPPHFGVELANALLLGVRLDASDVVARVRLLFAAGVEVVDGGTAATLDAVELATRHGLTAYDAGYLSLVLDVEGELATTDRALARAARDEGIPLSA
jgi:predicted nucleic acid-binding protein